MMVQDLFVVELHEKILLMLIGQHHKNLQEPKIVHNLLEQQFREEKNNYIHRFDSIDCNED